jgi:hypothetical protein
VEKLLTYGNCTQWNIVELEDGSHAFRCASTGLTFAATTDPNGALEIPTVDGLEFAEPRSTTATA